MVRKLNSGTDNVANIRPVGDVWEVSLTQYNASNEVRTISIGEYQHFMDAVRGANWYVPMDCIEVVTDDGIRFGVTNDMPDNFVPDEVRVTNLVDGWSVTGIRVLPKGVEVADYGEFADYTQAVAGAISHTTPSNITVCDIGTLYPLKEYVEYRKRMGYTD